MDKTDDKYIERASFETDLLDNGWSITSSTSTGISYSLPIPDDLDKAMRVASSSSSIFSFQSIEKIFWNVFNHFTAGSSLSRNKNK